MGAQGPVRPLGRSVPFSRVRRDPTEAPPPHRSDSPEIAERMMCRSARLGIVDGVLIGRQTVRDTPRSRTAIDSHLQPTGAQPRSGGMPDLREEIERL